MSHGTPADAVLQFYLPQEPGGTSGLPATVDEYWPWISRNPTIGEAGKYVWTLKTYLFLKQTDIPCRLVSTFPDHGLVVSHRDFLPLFLLPKADVFLVCIKPDRKEHTWAHYYVVQNGSDSIFRGARREQAASILHWPQASLIPRSQERGDRCDSLAYFGRALNLADELKSPAWPADLRELGFTWRSVPAAQWNDYSDVDLTVSVRGFGEAAGNDDPVLDPNSKPPSKLVNSWLAGVPAIVGRESAFRNIRRSSLDYVEVHTLEELRSAAIELRQNRQLYRDMVAHGRARSSEFSEGAVLSQWTALIEREILPRYQSWMRRSSITRQAINVKNTMAFLAAPRNLPSLRIYRNTMR